MAGCNLGRCAEFTSKILHALNAHAVNGRLTHAATRLAREAGSTRAPRGSGSEAEGAPAAHSSVLEKLAPVHRSAVAQAGPEGRAQKRSMAASADHAAECPRKKRRGDEGGRAGGARRVGVIHALVFAPVALAQVSLDMEKREELYVLSQVVVCSLWRSNLAEILHKTLEAGGGVAEGAHSVRVSLSFACGTLLSLDQSVVAASAAAHRAAPSEHQVLSTLAQGTPAAEGGAGGAGGAEAGGPAGDATAAATTRVEAVSSKKALRHTLSAYSASDTLVIALAEAPARPPARLSRLAVVAAQAERGGRALTAARRGRTGCRRALPRIRQGR